MAILALTAVLVPFTAGCIGGTTDSSDEPTVDEPEIETQASGPSGPLGPATITTPKPPIVSCSAGNGMANIVTTTTPTGGCTITLETANCKSNGNGGCTCDYIIKSESGPGCH